MDVDFYIIAPIMLDAIIINEQLQKGKEIMISSFSSNDLAIIDDYFNNKPNNIKNILFNKLTFISAFPDIFYRLFTK